MQNPDRLFLEEQSDQCLQFPFTEQVYITYPDRASGFYELGYYRND